MLDKFRSLLLWLHEPDHVARFQHFFGISPLFSQQTDLKSISHKRNLKKTYTDTNKKLTIHNGTFHPHHERKVTYDTNVLDECIQEIEHSMNTDVVENNSSPDIDYKINSWFWYYFFQFGSSLGNEIFYIVFFPAWIWNVDSCVARKVSILWAFFMYIGQATKDILAMTRPASPPVAHLEKRYVKEYGFPSTHAMFAAGIPLLFVLLSHQRYDFPLPIGILCAALVCIWVCLSRIYLGMHTFLDIIGGTLYALLLVYVMLPYIHTVDEFQLNSILSPLFVFCLGIVLIKCYPSVQEWSTARSDTTVILGSTIGFLAAETIMNKMNLLQRPSIPPIYPIIPPNLGLCLLRTFCGLIILYATRQTVKTIVLRATGALYGLNWKDPEIKRFAKVELPYYYLTYFSIGFNVAFTCPLIFRLMGINRDYTYTEL